MLTVVENQAQEGVTNISRLTSEWEEEYRQFQRRRFDDRDYVYVRADGVHFNVGLEDDRLCTLVLLGARQDGTKELLAVVDGYRESTESWQSVLGSKLAPSSASHKRLISSSESSRSRGSSLGGFWVRVTGLATTSPSHFGSRIA